MEQAPAQLEWTSRPDLTHQLDICPEADVEAWRLQVPAKGACYVLEEAGGRAVLLASCADLRQALVRRLGPQEQGQTPSKRVDYRSIVRRVRWRPVYSRFEANWTYLENARDLLPGTYRRLIKHWRSHWLSVELGDPHPRFIASDRPAGEPETCFGPLADARSARGIVELLEDVFDLCRYPSTLVLSPNGQACAYKQMGRCPAPCDGTVPMETYREQVRSAVEFLTQPRQAWIERVTCAMKEAARLQRFEEASRYKRQIERVKAADCGPLSRLAPLSQMRWLTLQRGPRAGSVRAFLLEPGAITFAGQIDPRNCQELLPELARRAAQSMEAPVSLGPAAAERTGLAAWHLLHADREPGVYLHASEVQELEQLTRAFEQVAHPKEPPHGPAVIELQSQAQ